MRADDGTGNAAHLRTIGCNPKLLWLVFDTMADMIV
jgi:hypothetical protein